MKINLKHFIHSLSRCAFFIGMVWIFAMMFLTTIDVTARYFFSYPIPGANELNEFMLAVFGFLGMAYTHQIDGNVRVTILESRLGAKWKLPHYICNVLSIGLIFLLAWQALKTGINEYHAGTTSASLRIPVYPFHFLMSAGVFILCLEIIVDLFSVNNRTA